MESNLRNYKGKEFIYRSKYGGVVKGVIESISPQYIINKATLKLEPKDIIVTSTKGAVYQLKEIEVQ